MSKTPFKQRLNSFFNLFKPTKKEATPRLKPLQMNKIRKANKAMQYYYEVNCELSIEGKHVGYFPLTVSAYSKAHVAKKLTEGVKLTPTNIHRSKRK